VTPSIRALIEAAAAEVRDRVPADATLIAVGWTTVELDRAATELGLTVTAAAGDAALGASCRSTDGPDGVTVVLLEPATEGRLAWSLARLGEGPYVTRWTAAGIDRLPVLGTSSGPLGRVRLLRDRPPDGRWQFLRERATATITA
jgi:hypothetical protein